MNSFNVLVTRKVEESLLRQISSVSPEVHVFDGADLTNGERSGDASCKSKLDAMLARADILLCDWPPDNVIVRTPNLKWIQSMLAGVDVAKYADVFQSPVVLTNTRGIHGAQMSELTFEMILMLAKQATKTYENKQKKNWERFSPVVIQSKTLGIIGLGSIGQEITRIAKAFKMKVIASRRSNKKTGTRYVDQLIDKDNLPELLSQSDFVVLALPATPESVKMIGEKELRCMKPSAYLINVARGTVVDEEALIKALEGYWIAGAGLDVYTTEPLPSTSKLWELPNVIINPHVGGVIDTYNLLAITFFCENLQRFIAGKKLKYIVDKKKGY